MIKLMPRFSNYDISTNILCITFYLKKADSKNIPLTNMLKSYYTNTHPFLETVQKG